MKGRYKSFAIQGNNKTRGNDPIEYWTTPTHDRLKERMEEWDWRKPFVIDEPDKPLVSLFGEALEGDKLPKEFPEPIKLFLYKSSKLNDFMRGTFLEQYGVFVSDRGKKILEEFNIGDFIFLPLTVVHKDVHFNNYFFFKCLTNSCRFIDFENSKFTERTRGEPLKRRELYFNDRNDVEYYYLKNRISETYIIANEIQFSEKFPDYDYFTIDDFGVHNIFISSRLAEKLNELTGFICVESTIFS